MASRHGARGEFNGWWRLGVAIVGPLCRLAFRLRFAGVERIPERGPAILAANHVSMLDGVVLALAPASERLRAIRFLVAAEFFDHLFIGWSLRRFGQIAVHRGEGDDEALEEAVRTIRAGALAGIFPEGRVGDGLELQRGRTGVARIALAAGAPVVPVGIHGTQSRWPRSGLHLRRPFRARVTLSFGEPIPPQGDLGVQEDVEAFTDAVMAAIARQVEDAGAATAH